MLDNLTEREKKLALAVACLLPLVLIFAVVYWMGSQLSDKHSKITALRSEQTALMKKQLDAMQASQRRAVYRSESLPSNTNIAVSLYESWLSVLGSEKLGHGGSFSIKSLNRGADKYVSGRAGGRPEDLVYSDYSYSITGKGNIDQLTEFLYEFHRAKILHRIKAVNIKPEVQGPGARQSRSEILDIRLTVDAICMPDAPAERNFADEIKTDFPRSFDDYKNVVAHRNLFGLPNNAPEWRTTGQQDKETGKAFAIDLSADDKDEDDNLTLELVNSSVPEARLVQTDAKGRKARLEIPGLDRGRYEFETLATDDGCPAKMDTMKLVVVVDDPPERKPPPEKPKPKHARETYVSAAITNSQGKLEVWINCLTLGKFYELTEGESFELDDQEWTIIKIIPPEVIIEVNGEKMVFVKNRPLSEPLRKYTPVDAPVARRNGRPK